MTSVGQGFVGLAATVIQRVSMGKVRRWCAGPVVATMIATSMTGCAGDDNSKWRLLGTDAPPSTHGGWRVPSMSGAGFVTAYRIESGVARSEERRGGTEGVRTCRSWWSPATEKNKKKRWHQSNKIAKT